MSRLRTIGEQLSGWLGSAPPHLDDGVEALSFWSRRSGRLPWWRIHARREAVEMTVRWERRIWAALVSEQRMPIEARASAAALVARTRWARWARRARIGLLAAATTVVVVVAIPTAAALVLLLNAL